MSAKTLKNVLKGAKAVVCAAIFALLGVLGYDAVLAWREREIPFEVAQKLLAYLPKGEVVTREAVIAVKNTAKAALATTERNTVYHIKIGFDFAQIVPVRDIEPAADPVKIALGPVKIISIASNVESEEVVSKRLLAYFTGTPKVDFPVENELQGLIAEVRSQGLTEPEKVAEPLKTMLAPSIEAALGRHIEFVPPPPRDAEEIFSGYFAEK